METKKKSWTELLFAYAKNEKKKMLLSVILMCPLSSRQ